MATLTRTATKSRADAYLTFLEEEWKRVPAVIRQWSGWDEDRRLEFQLEWGLRRDRLHSLRQMRQAGSLSEEQLRRLRDLEAQVRCYEEQLEALFN